MRRLAKIGLSLVIVVLGLSCLAGSAKADSAISIQLSSTTITPGVPLHIEIQFNTTDFWEPLNATITISNEESGMIVVQTSEPLDILGHANYTFTPERPSIFGEYFIWVRVGNASGFHSFELQPSILDLWEKMNKYEKSQAASSKTANTALWLVMTAVPLGVIGAAFVSYLYWRLDDPTKEEARDWLLSKFDIRKLRVLTRDIRDLKRYAYARRRFPGISMFEKQISDFSHKERLLTNLADSAHKKLDFYRKRLAEGEAFEKDLRETATKLSEKIAKNEARIDDELRAVQIHALETNRQVVRDPKRLRKEMEAARGSNNQNKG